MGGFGGGSFGVVVVDFWWICVVFGGPFWPCKAPYWRLLAPNGPGAYRVLAQASVCDESGRPKHVTDPTMGTKQSEINDGRSRSAAALWMALNLFIV